MTGAPIEPSLPEPAGQEPPNGPRVLRPDGATASYAAVLRNGPFLRLWLAQAISQTGNSMVDFAMLLRVSAAVEFHQVAQANTAVSLVILAFSIPGVIFGPFAGAVADRVDRKLLMALVNVLRAGGVFLFLVVRPEWHVQTILAGYYAIAFFFGTVGQFFAPAQGAAIPDLVPRAQLVQANALFNLTFTAAQLLGFTVLGPVAAKLLGVDLLLATSAALFLGCAALTMTLPALKRARASNAAKAAGGAFRGLLADVREGLVYILDDPMLMRAIGFLTIASTTFLMVASLGPEFVRSVIGLPEEDIGYIVAPAGIGIVVGVILVPRLARRYSRESLVDWGLTLAGVMLLLLATNQILLTFALGGSRPSQVLEIVVAGGLAALLGVCNAFVLVPAQTVLQERSHEHIRARVYATFYTISNTVAFIPIFFAAAAADLFGVVQVLAVVALILIAIGGKSVGRRRTEQAARRTRVRTRHRQGPESFG